MFEDSLIINLGIFAAGQIVAYLYLRTGRRRRGLALMIGAWILIDAALVQRFAFGKVDWVFYATLCGMQIWSVYEVFTFAYLRLRRRRPAVLARRDEEFRRGFEAYLRDDLEPAIVAFSELVRRDPWDLPVVVALATALDRSGDPRHRGRSQSLFRAARDLDVKADYADVLAGEPRSQPQPSAVTASAVIAESAASSTPAAEDGEAIETVTPAKTQGKALAPAGGESEGRRRGKGRRQGKRKRS